MVMDFRILPRLGYKRIDNTKQNNVVSSPYVNNFSQLSIAKSDSVSFGAAQNLPSTHTETMSQDTMQVYDSLKVVLDETAQKTEKTLKDFLLQKLNLSSIIGVKLNVSSLISDYSLNRQGKDSSASFTKLSDDSKYEYKLVVKDANKQKKEIFFSKNELHTEGEDIPDGELNKIVKDELMKLSIEHKKIEIKNLIDKFKAVYQNFVDTEFRCKPWRTEYTCFTEELLKKYCDTKKYPNGKYIHSYSKVGDSQWILNNKDDRGNIVSYYKLDKDRNGMLLIAGYVNEKSPVFDVHLGFDNRFFHTVVSGTFEYEDTKYTLKSNPYGKFKKSLSAEVPGYGLVEADLAGDPHIKITKDSVTNEIKLNSNGDIVEYYTIDKDGNRQNLLETKSEKTLKQEKRSQKTASKAAPKATTKKETPVKAADKPATKKTSTKKTTKK